MGFHPYGIRPPMFAIVENGFSAFDALTRNWTRTLLTMTGIMVGVLSIVTLIAIMKGVKAEISSQVQGLGANLVIIVPGKLDDNGQPNPAAMIGISTLSRQDVDALKRVPGVVKISPVSMVSGLAEFSEGKEDRTANAFVVGTNRAGVEMNPTRLVAGRYFDDNEQHVCILSIKPTQELFPNENPLGKQVTIGGIRWTVVGLLGKPGGDATLGGSLLGLSTLVYLPINTVQKEIPGGQVNRIVLQTDYSHPADKMVATMTETLKATHHGYSDFGIITQEKALKLVIKFLNLAQSLLVLIAGISLFVAGISIMNIMLVTVTERTREIGIRKTVGARNNDIFLQFLIEAIVLSLAGCLNGLLLSKLLCAGIAHFAPLQPEITWRVVGLAMLACILVGVLFGVAPAVRASRLDPIDALRHE